VSGFFGIIHTDTEVFERHQLVPHAGAVALIERFRAEIASPRFAGNTISLDRQFDEMGLAEADAGILALLIALVFQPPSPEEQMIAATGIALLIRTPFFYVTGAIGRQCQLQAIEATTAMEAEIDFLTVCIEQYVL
jgi:hypothetical protein